VPDQGILEDRGNGHMVVRDCWGRVTEWFPGTEASQGAHKILRDGVRNRADWEPIRSHFRADDPWRYPGSIDTSRPAYYFPQVLWPPAPYQGEPDTYESLLGVANSGEKLLQCTGPSMLGDLKEEMGYENLCIAMYEDRRLLEEMIWTRTDLALTVLDTLMDRVPFAILHFWEDIAYNAGPLISPKLFGELIAPAYRAIIDLFRAKGGQIVSVDSDGDIRLLIPGWLEAGVNHFWPMEAKANVDVVALRREYGRSFTMRGGINKHALLAGKDAIRRELERVAPVVEDGGYMPMIDHSIPEGIPFEDFCAYMELKHEILGVQWTGASG